MVHESSKTTLTKKDRDLGAEGSLPRLHSERGSDEKILPYRNMEKESTLQMANGRLQIPFILFSLLSWSQATDLFWHTSVIINCSYLCFPVQSIE